ncbi:ashwin-like isoform X2 [Bacillus rossius redtenbacheri]|uniref:ashwin-like isoform X2 n=1 Tax=Bacillus rossius redtenbacheri TaxID=93214 RepID=UPI002FDE285B
MHMVAMAEENEKGLNEIFLLLQPHLLNDSTLINILKDRCVRRQGLASLRRDQLLELFYHVAVPLPQRKYRDNRRGRILTRIRERLERTRQVDSSPSTVQIGFREGSSSCRSPATAAAERLKPPPSGASLERRKIRLSTDSSGGQSKRLKTQNWLQTNGDSLDRVIIKNRTKEKGADAKPTSSCGLTEKMAEVQLTSSGAPDETEVPKKIKLKRTFSNSSSSGVISSSQVSSTSVDTEKEVSRKKLKRKITWP